MEADRLDHATIGTALRAPRVAVVIPGDMNWQYWARAAIFSACETWGGQGFIIVPESRGKIDPLVLQATIAYDPDYVVVLDTKYAHYDELYPGLIDRQLSDLPPESPELPRLREEIGSAPVNIEELAQARRVLANACSVYRIDADSGEGEADEEHRGTEHETYLYHPVQKAPLTSVEELRGLEGSVPVAARNHLVGSFGVAAAARLGLLLPPRARGVEPDEHHSRSIVRWLLNFRDPGRANPPPYTTDAFPDVPASDAPTAWAASMQGLVPVSNTNGQPNQSLVVLGASAHDFALAMIWDRLYGRGVWIPESWWDGGRAPLATTVLEQLEHTISYTHRSSREKWIVASTSSDENTLTTFRNAVASHPSGIFMQGIESVMPAGAIQVAREASPLSYKERGKFHYGVARQFSSRTTLPVLRDSLGSTVLAATPAAPMVTSPQLRGIQSLAWQVDIDIVDTPMPPGRGIPASELLHSEESRFGTYLRSSRSGLSFEAQSHGLILAGAAEEDRLARPRVRKPGLFAWAQARARMRNRDVVTSSAGMHAQLLQRLIGGREQLIDEMCSGTRKVFDAYTRSGKSTISVFPKGEGCLARNHPYLNIEGFASIGNFTLAQARDKCDHLLTRRVLTGGLILNCGACDDLSFFSIDRLQQSNACIRCGQSNELEQVRWKSPRNEPMWFYDLHPAAIALMKENGEVPLLLSGYLRSCAAEPRRYRDTHEIAVLNGRKMVAELDLLALTDGRVIVAEAKTTTALDPNSRERDETAQKKVILAEIFAADEIILGTTRHEWTDSSIEAMKKAISDHNWRTQSPPRLRTITKLGTDSVRDQYT